MSALRSPDEIARELVKGGIAELELVLDDEQEAAILMCRKNYRTSTYEKTVRILARLIERSRAEGASSAAPETSPIPMLNTIGVLEEVRKEREVQDAKWGGPEADDMNRPNDWIAYMTGHLGRAWTSDLATYRKQLIRVAALAVAAAESLDRATGTAPKGGGA